MFIYCKRAGNASEQGFLNIYTIFKNKKNLFEYLHKYKLNFYLFYIKSPKQLD